MNYFVTGGCGFIGSHVVEKLLEITKKTDNIIVIDDLSSGKKENIKYSPRCIFIEHDIRRNYIIENLFRFYKPEIVFHLAAVPRVQYSIKNPKLTNSVNINGTLDLLLYSRDFKIKRFIYSSSSSVYGEQKTLPLHEYMTPNPMSPYALQKFTGEYYCKLFNNIYGLKTISLRYFNVFGPRQNEKGDYACMIPKFINKIINNEQPIIFGDGEQTRGFTYVDNVVDANFKAAFTDNQDAFGEVYNVGSYLNRSVNEVTKLIKRISGNLNIKPIYDSPVIEPKHTKSCNYKITDMLDWYETVNFESGLKKTYEYFKSKKGD